jgi:hypothetical protein
MNNSNTTKGPNITMILIIILFVVALFITMIIVCTQCGNDTEPRTAKEPTREPVKTMSVEHKMATIDHGQIDENNPKISDYKRHLDSLERKTINTRIDISDITVTAQNLLSEEGIDRTLLQILRDLDNSIPEGSTDIKLEEIASAYMVLMTD